MRHATCATCSGLQSQPCDSTIATHINLDCHSLGSSAEMLVRGLTSDDAKPYARQGVQIRVSMS
jgi:hypothetical protein